MLKVEPKDVQLIGDEIAIVWSDGTESYFKKEMLRRACPCAACGGEPDVLGRVVRPKVTYVPKSFDWNGYRSVGGYAIQPIWGDGHETGLYSWQYLKKLGQG